MENLLKPDVGLMFWTVVTFLLMVFILKKVAWTPLLKVIDARESQIKKEMELALAHRTEMESLKKEYEGQLSQIESRAKSLLSEAEQKGLEMRERILQEAEEEAQKLSERSRQQLELEKERLVSELRKEVGTLSVQVTEKLLKQSVDKKVQEKFVQDMIKDLGKFKKTKSVNS
ncbi:MAG: F0F1 ATP synthase subunit B [Elusimicrobia bacterium]|nr:F0F1 ATP synthase subunit B [Elusimicrobiota bacterium]MBI2916119.1 F0F1 ATP synthase subunit B [Elusimicrobiota bacterium]MBI3012302.1 F0F1 ATP synthase subunit B [Elusimicrobiota bacterium]MBI4218286.1 F0F1 ATP synthase subunit B [Elusimicrobiota bacterium]